MSISTNHPQSGICTDTRLDIFSVPPTLAAFDSYESVQIYPITALGPDAPITFSVNNQNENTYLNFSNAFFVISAKLERFDGKGISGTIKNETGEEVAYQDKVTISNNISSTLIRNMEVSINEISLSTSDNFFVRNGLDNLLHTPDVVQKSIVKGGQHLYLRGNSANSVDDDGWNKRNNTTKSGKVFDIIVPFNTDLGSSNKFFPPGSEIKITLKQNSPEFYLVKGPLETNKHRLNIESIYLEVTKASIINPITDAHHGLFQKKNAAFSMRRVTTSERVIPQGTTDIDFPIFTNGQVPYNITMVLLPTTTFTGDSFREPLFFERHNLSNAELIMDTKSIKYNYERERSAFNQTIMALNEEKVSITYTDFTKNGLFFIYFNLSNGTPNNVMRPVVRTNLRVALKWNVATTTPLTLLMLTESVGTLELTGKKRSKPPLKMNNKELEAFIKKTPAAPFFNGIIEPSSSRELSDGFWVVFLNPHNLPVGHWTGLFINKKRAWFFNSLGDANGRDQVKDLLRGFRTTYNVDRLQSPISEVCGLYVIYYFIRTTAGVPFGSFLNEFVTNTLLNDLCVYEGTRYYFYNK